MNIKIVTKKPENYLLDHYNKEIHYGDWFEVMSSHSPISRFKVISISPKTNLFRVEEIIIDVFPYKKQRTIDFTLASSSPRHMAGFQIIKVIDSGLIASYNIALES